MLHYLSLEQHDPGKLWSKSNSTFVYMHIELDCMLLIFGNRCGNGPKIRDQETLMRTPKVPNHETLDAQHSYEKKEKKGFKF